MFNSSKRAPILHSKTLNKRRIESLNKQLGKVPVFWKKRFIEDMWQLIITDNMPEECGGAFVQYFANGNDKKIWINISIPTVLDNIIWKAMACYVYIEYANLQNSKTFNRIIKDKENEIRLFMTFREVFHYDEIQIFSEMFSFVIETEGNYTSKKLSSLYLYLKKWVTGEIFNENIFQLPNYIEIGRDVINDQVESVKDAFLMLPIKLQRRFINDRWKIRISHEEIEGNSIYGLCSSFNKKIIIRSSAPDIKKTTLHEFGHYLDYKENFASNKNYFEKVCFSEKMRLVNFYKLEKEFYYAISSKEEYFAEIFAFYIINADNLNAYVPESTQFIRRIIKKWS